MWNLGFVFTPILGRGAMNNPETIEPKTLLLPIFIEVLFDFLGGSNLTSIESHGQSLTQLKQTTHSLFI